MAFILNDRVKVTSTTQGTGVFALGSATAGFETFASGIGGSNTTYYAIAHQSSAEFEVSFGTLDSDGDALTRTSSRWIRMTTCFRTYFYSNYLRCT